MKAKHLSLFLGFMTVASPIFSQYDKDEYEQQPQQQQPTIKQQQQKVVKPQVVSDFRLRQMIQNTLKAGTGSFSRRFSSVTFSVDLGYVNLKGFVETDDDKDDVEAAIRQIPGVQGVRNDIQVRAKTSRFSAPTVPY